jgi:hypothetical protein
MTDGLSTVNYHRIGPHIFTRYYNDMVFPSGKSFKKIKHFVIKLHAVDAEMAWKYIPMNSVECHYFHTVESSFTIVLRRPNRIGRKSSIKGPSGTSPPTTKNDLRDTMTRPAQTCHHVAQLRRPAADIRRMLRLPSFGRPPWFNKRVASRVSAWQPCFSRRTTEPPLLASGGSDCELRS